MQATLLTPEELTAAERAALWAQEVCLDDWDYLVLAPVDTLTLRMRQDSYDGTHYDVWQQEDFLLERLLLGCCSNHWYKATFRGQEYAIGIAYHA